MFSSIIKPFFDRVFAFVGLVILFPLFLILLMVLSFEHSGKPIFVQKRGGFRRKPFNIYKFRTLNDAKDENGNHLPLEKRVTKIGKFLRKTSMDEFPQLINILKGEMSFVGPRPLLIEYLDIYNRVEAARHLVMPGITGWAQINGRNHIGWAKKFEYDLWYVRNTSFWLDIKILLLTVKGFFFHNKNEDSTCINVPEFERIDGDRVG